MESPPAFHFQLAGDYLLRSNGYLISVLQPTNLSSGLVKIVLYSLSISIVFTTGND